MLKFAKIEMGQDVCPCGRGWIYGRGTLIIGDKTWLSPGVLFYTHHDAPIAIGNNCDIGPSVEFITGTHVIGTENRRAGIGLALPIDVNDGCWIGAGSKILGGVQIGPGSIIAAGSVVINDVPKNSLAAGVPAKVKKILN